jgi:hypothetical protein
VATAYVPAADSEAESRAVNRTMEKSLLPLPVDRVPGVAGGHAGGCCQA